MKDRVKNIGLIFAVVISGISLPTSIVSFVDKPTAPIIEIYNYYYNNTIIERYNQTIIEQVNNTGKQVIQPITFLPALNSGATLEGIWIDLDAVGEFMYSTFFANSDVVDTDEDIIFRFIMNSAQTDENLQMLQYAAHTKTDNTSTAIFSWNIEIDVPISFNTTAIVMFIYEYVFNAADVEDDDWLSFALKLNETGRSLAVMYAEVEYIHV
jgi:hypothetical protein